MKELSAKDHSWLITTSQINTLDLELHLGLYEAQSEKKAAHKKLTKGETDLEKATKLLKKTVGSVDKTMQSLQSGIEFRPRDLKVLEQHIDDLTKAIKSLNVAKTEIEQGKSEWYNAVGKEVQLFIRQKDKDKSPAKGSTSEDWQDMLA